jgi:transposase
MGLRHLPGQQKRLRRLVPTQRPPGRHRRRSPRLRLRPLPRRPHRLAPAITPDELPPRTTKTNKPLYRAYLLKEQLREVFAVGGQAGAVILDAWLRWAARSKLTPFVDLARKIRTYYRGDIINTLTHQLSNGLIEATNTKIRLLTRIAFGFKSVDALIALAKLHLGGYNIELPGRT